MSGVPEVRPARDDREVDAGFDLAHRTFPPSYEEARAHHHRRRALEGPTDPADAIVAISEGGVVGFVWILSREMWIGGEVVQVGGISLVSVREDLRGRGIGLRLMDVAIERHRERGDRLSILFARRAVDRWYPKLGYVGIGAHVDLVATSGTQEPGAAVVGGFDERAWDAYARAYEASYRGLFMSFRRDARWWGSARERYELQAGQGAFRAVAVGGSTVGFFATRERKLIEMAALDGHQATVLAAWERECAGGAPASALPLGHWASKELRRREHTTTVRFSWDGGHMVRILERGVLEMIATGRWPDVDLRDHASAKRAALEIAGAGALPEPLWGHPPSWSPVDEL
jgi:predicted N-acetyltransferase YhbS